MDNDFPNITIVILLPFLSFHHSFCCSRSYSIIIPNAIDRWFLLSYAIHAIPIQIFCIPNILVLFLLFSNIQT